MKITSMMLTEEDTKLLDAIKKNTGIIQNSSVIRLAIRKTAKGMSK